MIRLMTLLKRKEGMSKADFTAYYESHHRVIGEKVLAGYATRYVRHHLHPLDGETLDQDPDVILEIEFPDQAAMDAFFASASQPAIAAEIAPSEAPITSASRAVRPSGDRPQTAKPTTCPAVWTDTHS